MPWSTLDVASPEREYSPDSCPGGISKPFMSDYRSERERARASLCRMLNVSYGAASIDRLDFFPASFADTPVLVFFTEAIGRRFPKKTRAFQYLAPAIIGIKR